MKKNPSPKSPKQTRPSKSPSRWPVVVTSLFLVYVLISFAKPTLKTSLDVNGFGALPVLNGGRIKPIDTVARVSLLIIHGKQSLKSDGKKMTAIEWLMEVMFRTHEANHLPSFRIDDPDVLGLLRKEHRSPPHYSFEEIAPSFAEIESQAGQAEQIKSEKRTAYQRAIVQLQNKLIIYQKLQNTLQLADVDRFTDFLMTDGKNNIVQHEQHFAFMDRVAEFLPLPDPNPAKDNEQWISVGKSLMRLKESPDFNTGAITFARMGDAYRLSDGLAFNVALSEHQQWLLGQVPNEVRLAKKEILFNRVQPFMKSMVLYLVAALLVFFSWMGKSKEWVRVAWGLILLSLVVHTAGLITRMVLQGRPPVTNLYSSAIFIGWASVILGLVLEKIYKNSVGLLVSASIGFITMIIAHNLASTGDTLEMMRAVLDTNFWLATHVVTVTIGYSSTFLAGFLALVTILRRYLQRNWSQSEQQTLESMVFGVVCFSTFFSFVGTVLGGIWADQSWGRFWGWDPKENGALLIVLWNAFILHARKLGFARGLRIMMLAIVGNIITAFSWFGVNMLGIGLHSYGFMEAAFIWILIFTFSQLTVIGLALTIPPQKN